MAFYDWDKEKNEKLKIERNVSFEEVILAINNNNLLETIKNPSSNFPDQMAFVVRINNYIYYIPFVKNDKGYFLKTIIPSRKALKKYSSKK